MLTVLLLEPPKIGKMTFLSLMAYVTTLLTFHFNNNSYIFEKVWNVLHWRRYKWSGFCLAYNSLLKNAAHRHVVIGIDHDKVCAVVVCAATPGTARGRATAGPTSAVPGVAAQTTTAQTVWVVNFYFTTKTKHNDKSSDDHDDEPLCWNALAGNAIVMMKASKDTLPE